MSMVVSILLLSLAFGELEISLYVQYLDANADLAQELFLIWI